MAPGLSNLIPTGGLGGSSRNAASSNSLGFWTGGPAIVLTSQGSKKAM